ncbi:MAG: hypothetical protein AAF591_21580 [Verrucomicrobiota bacterium]
MIYFLFIVVMLVGAMAAQEFMPVMDFAQQARVLLVPAVFFASAVTVSYPVMLILALMAGFMWDARNVVLVESPVDLVAMFSEQKAQPGTEVDLPFGYSILLYGLLGSLMQGVRPLYMKGRWELPTVMVGAVTFLLLLFEYLFINFRRGDFYFPQEVWEKIIASALPSMAIAPLVFLILSRLARWAGYRSRYEGLAYGEGHGR